jgi:multiple sugar transport system substrate-binding protein
MYARSVGSVSASARLVYKREEIAMHGFKGSMLALPALALLTISASAGQYVDWKDDGSAVLKLGEAYNNATIQTAPGELGSAFGPDKKPFDGITITVTVNGAGPKGGISGPLHQFRPIWEELSGGKVNIVELPFAEHYTKMMLDLRSGTGQYDAFMVGAFWYGDIVPAGYGYATFRCGTSGGLQERVQL